MAIDPNRWTIKSQEAFAAAAELARTENNAEITPDHLLAALVAQPEGLAVPLLGRAGVEPTALVRTLDGRLVVAGQVLRQRPAPDVARPEPRARRRRHACAGTWATSTCRWSTCCWPWPTGPGPRGTNCWRR